MSSQCFPQLASAINYNPSTTAFSFANAPSPTQLCQKKEDGSYDCAAPSVGLGGLGAPQSMFCYKSNIAGHIKCFNNPDSCADAVANRNGLNEVIKPLSSF